MAYSAADIPDQSDQIALVTGANSGIGFETARMLATRGANVLLGCRSAEKAEAARQRLLDEVEEVDDASVATVILDLGSLASIKAAAKILQKQPHIDLLINNAGLMMPPRELTADGFESQFGVNHLGHFALTAHLLPQVLKAPAGRIVTVSSLAHQMGVIDFDDLHAEVRYSPLARYQMSKLANLLFAFELQRQLADAGAAAISVACHPGIAATELMRHLPSAASAMLPLMRTFVNTSAEGALPTLRAATDPQARGGDYFGPAGFMELTRSASRVNANLSSRNRALARRLWEVSAELTGTDPARCLA